MVRHAGKADGAEQDAVGLGHAFHAVGRHHGAGFLVGLAGPVVLVEFQGEAEAALGGIEHAQGFGHGFLADAVAGDDRDAVGLAHVRSSLSGAKLPPGGTGCKRGELSGRDWGGRIPTGIQ